VLQRLSARGLHATYGEEADQLCKQLAQRPQGLCGSKTMLELLDEMEQQGAGLGLEQVVRACKVMKDYKYLEDLALVLGGENVTRTH